MHQAVFIHYKISGTADTGFDFRRRHCHGFRRYRIAVGVRHRHRKNVIVDFMTLNVRRRTSIGKRAVGVHGNGGVVSKGNVHLAGIVHHHLTRIFCAVNVHLHRRAIHVRTKLKAFHLAADRHGSVCHEFRRHLRQHRHVVDDVHTDGFNILSVDLHRERIAVLHGVGRVLCAIRIRVRSTQRIAVLDGGLAVRRRAAFGDGQITVTTLSNDILGNAHRTVRGNCHRYTADGHRARLTVQIHHQLTRRGLSVGVMHQAVFIHYKISGTADAGFDFRRRHRHGMCCRIAVGVLHRYVEGVAVGFGVLHVRRRTAIDEFTFGIHRETFTGLGILRRERPEAAVLCSGKRGSAHFNRQRRSGSICTEDKIKLTLDAGVRITALGVHPKCGQHRRIVHSIDDDAARGFLPTDRHRHSKLVGLYSLATTVTTVCRIVASDALSVTVHSVGQSIIILDGYAAVWLCFAYPDVRQDAVCTRHRLFFKGRAIHAVHGNDSAVFIHTDGQIAYPDRPISMIEIHRQSPRCHTAMRPSRLRLRIGTCVKIAFVRCHSRRRAAGIPDNRRILEYRRHLPALLHRIAVGVGHGQSEVVRVLFASHICCGAVIGEFATFRVIGQLAAIIGARFGKRDGTIFFTAEDQMALVISRYLNREHGIVDLHRNDGRSAFPFSCTHVGAEVELL